MNIIDQVTGAWKAFCRPPRQSYTLFDLGSPVLLVKGIKCKRQDFKVTNKRGFQLECSFFQTITQPLLDCVIYLHCFNGSRLESIKFADQALERGCSFCCFDFSGSGLSQGDYVSLGYFEQEDVEVVIEYLRLNMGISQIGLWGRSMGAVTALLYAQKFPQEVQSLAIDSAFVSMWNAALDIADKKVSLPTFLIKGMLEYVRRQIKSNAGYDMDEVNTLKDLDKCTMPILFIVSKEDKLVSHENSTQLYQKYPENCQKSILYVKGDHNECREWENIASILDFLSSTLKRSCTPEQFQESLQEETSIPKNEGDLRYMNDPHSSFLKSEQNKSNNLNNKRVNYQEQSSLHSRLFSNNSSLSPCNKPIDPKSSIPNQNSTNSQFFQFGRGSISQNNIHENKKSSNNSNQEYQQNHQTYKSSSHQHSISSNQLGTTQINEMGPQELEDNPFVQSLLKELIQKQYTSLSQEANKNPQDSQGFYQKEQPSYEFQYNRDQSQKMTGFPYQQQKQQQEEREYQTNKDSKKYDQLERQQQVVMNYGISGLQNYLQVQSVSSSFAVSPNTSQDLRTSRIPDEKHEIDFPKLKDFRTKYQINQFNNSNQGDSNNQYPGISQSYVLNNNYQQQSNMNAANEQSQQFNHNNRSYQVEEIPDFVPYPKNNNHHSNSTLPQYQNVAHHNLHFSSNFPSEKPIQGGQLQEQRKNLNSIENLSYLNKGRQNPHLFQKLSPKNSSSPKFFNKGYNNYIPSNSISGAKNFSTIFAEESINIPQSHNRNQNNQISNGYIAERQLGSMTSSHFGINEENEDEDHHNLPQTTLTVNLKKKKSVQLEQNSSGPLPLTDRQRQKSKEDQEAQNERKSRKFTFDVGDGVGQNQNQYNSTPPNYSIFQSEILPSMRDESLNNKDEEKQDKREKSSTNWGSDRKNADNLKKQGLSKKGGIPYQTPQAFQQYENRQRKSEESVERKGIEEQASAKNYFGVQSVSQKNEIRGNQKSSQSNLKSQNSLKEGSLQQKESVITQKENGPLGLLRNKNSSYVLKNEKNSFLKNITENSKAPFNNIFKYKLDFDNTSAKQQQTGSAVSLLTAGKLPSGSSVPASTFNSNNINNDLSTVNQNVNQFQRESRTNSSHVSSNTQAEFFQAQKGKINQERENSAHQAQFSRSSVSQTSLKPNNQWEQTSNKPSPTIEYQGKINSFTNNSPFISDFVKPMLSIYTNQNGSSTQSSFLSGQPCNNTNNNNQSNSTIIYKDQINNRSTPVNSSSSVKGGNQSDFAAVKQFQTQITEISNNAAKPPLSDEQFEIKNQAIHRISTTGNNNNNNESIRNVVDISISRICAPSPSSHAKHKILQKQIQKQFQQPQLQQQQQQFSQQQQQQKPNSFDINPAFYSLTQEDYSKFKRQQNYSNQIQDIPQSSSSPLSFKPPIDFSTGNQAAIQRNIEVKKSRVIQQEDNNQNGYIQQNYLQSNQQNTLYARQPSRDITQSNQLKSNVPQISINQIVDRQSPSVGRSLHQQSSSLTSQKFAFKNRVNQATKVVQIQLGDKNQPFIYEPASQMTYQNRSSQSPSHKLILNKD